MKEFWARRRRRRRRRGQLPTAIKTLTKCSWPKAKAQKEKFAKYAKL